ncbi:DUF1178 family protein [Sphingomonas sp. A2-49]|uniref:DUF1178 family protein n=1 Tax=Sphingomonas sp. A2-49 TaxID=1391375 RepID=UPI0021D14C7F|nr:DUF1178 family protein [Sphingomonas sp. A2-49]MCU6453521.1 DUF1178 family protein [Sphingomonas sp. A2-49]
MIVFDLRCEAGHVFEAWFGSSRAYDEQAAAGQVACPLCGDVRVGKAVMAPSLSGKGNRRDDPPPPAAIKQALRRLADMQSKALAGSQWVGSAFAERARAMHQGEEDSRPIHGRASIADAQALVAEGVPVAPLPLPVVPPEKAN